MSIQAVSFGKQAITKKGNPYEKTNLGGKIGAAVGAGYATLTGVKTVKLLKKLDVKELATIFRESRLDVAGGSEAIIQKSQDYAARVIKNTKNAVIPAIAIFTGLSILAGLGIGKVADAITNKVRRNKADAQNA